MFEKILAYFVAVIVSVSLLGCSLSAQEFEICTDNTIQTTEVHVHSFIKEIVEPTCSLPGYINNICECGYSYISDETESLGHNYESIIYEVSCEDDGYTLYKCIYCGFEYSDNIIKSSGHNYKTNVVDVTCLDDGYTIYECESCDDSYIDNVITALGHNYKIDTIIPSVNSDGYDVHTCCNCGHSYKDNYVKYVPTYKQVNETVYVTSPVNIRNGAGKSYNKIGEFRTGDAVNRIGIGDNGWSKIVYDGKEAYVYSNYLSLKNPLVVSPEEYPLRYSDETCTITIDRVWRHHAWCYIAHLQFADYSRFGSDVALGERGNYETTSHAAKRLGAILCVNGPYNWGELKTAYAIVRGGKVFNDKQIIKDIAIYNSNTGIMGHAEELGINGMMASDAVNEGLVTDTLKFWNSTIIKNGKNLVENNSYDRAQRTFIGTNGNPGDLYIVVADGRKVDGESIGLTIYECADILLELECTYGFMLDGGGSSTMVFDGKVLNANRKNERAVVDFVYLR